MPHQFLTVYDYGMGGVWQWITAESKEQILAKYPALHVYERGTFPEWWSERGFEIKRTYHIDDPPDKVLRNFMVKD